MCLVSLLPPLPRQNGVVIQGVISGITPTAVRLHDRVHPIQFDFLVIALGGKYTFPFKFGTNTSVDSTAHQTCESSSLTGQVAPATPPGPSTSSDSTSSQPPLQFMLDAQALCFKFYDEVRSSKRIVIIGGGCVGIEVAGELATKYGRYGNGKKTVMGVQQHQPLKFITLIHSSSQLMNRHTGMRDKMREAALDRLRKLGVEVILNERVDLEGIHQFGIDMNDPFLKLGTPFERIKRQGYLVASSILTCFQIRTKSTLTDGTALTDGEYQADMILTCTGTEFDSSLFTDSEIRTAVDHRGRLIVNDYFQLDGYVTSSRREASKRYARLHGGSVGVSSQTGTGLSDPHGQFSYHHPHIFAIGDCCIPRKEVHLNLPPQSSLAQHHARHVATNIGHILVQRPLLPYGRSNPSNISMSIGRNYGLTQVSTSYGIGDTARVVRTSRPCMYVDTHWSLLNQDRTHLSFKGRASQGFMEQMERSVSSSSRRNSRTSQSREESISRDSPSTPSSYPGSPASTCESDVSDVSDGSYAPNLTVSNLRCISGAMDGVVGCSKGMSTLDLPTADETSISSPHPRDSILMRAQAAIVEAKLAELRIARIMATTDITAHAEITDIKTSTVRPSSPIASEQRPSCETQIIDTTDVSRSDPFQVPLSTNASSTLTVSIEPPLPVASPSPPILFVDRRLDELESITPNGKGGGVNDDTTRFDHPSDPDVDPMMMLVDDEEDFDSTRRYFSIVRAKREHRPHTTRTQRA